MAWRGQLSKNLKELRILFCQTSPASSSTRAFVEKNYKELKKVNPKLPILIRECSGTEPQLWARYALLTTRKLDHRPPPPPRFILREAAATAAVESHVRRSLALLASPIDMGVERGLSLEGMSEEQISKALQELNKTGASLKA